MKNLILSLILGALFPLCAQAENAATRHADNCQQQGLMWDPEQYQCVSTNTKTQEENEFDRESRRSKPPAETQTQDSTSTQYTSPAQVWGENCRALTDSAVNACDFENNPTLKASVDLATSMKQQMENSVASSVKTLCSKMGAMTQSLNAAALAFNGYCTNAFMQCQQACAADLAQATGAVATGMATQADVTGIQSLQRKCNGLTANLNYAKQNIQKYAQVEAQKAQACNQAVSTVGGGAGGLGAGLEPCLKDPNSPACLKALSDQDCSNPASTNLICVCARNSRDPRCGSGGSGLGSLPYSKGGGTDAGKAKLGDIGTSGMGLAGGGPSDLIAVPPNQDSGGGGSRGAGGGGGGRGGSFGPGQGGAVGKAGPGGTSLSGKTITGYGYGGRGGGAGGGGYGAGGAGAFGRPGMPGMGQANGKNVDLRQFLPGGQMDPSRGLAGISGPDGITGPNSDIWKKINKRYFSVSPSLLP